LDDTFDKNTTANKISYITTGGLMMDNMCGSTGGGVGIIGILVSVTLVLAIAALVKHLFFNKK